MIPAGEMAGGRVSLSDTTGYMSKIRVQFCGEVAPAGCTQHIFRLGKGKTCVDQSAQPISRWMKMNTLLCRQMTRVHPVVSSTFLFDIPAWRSMVLYSILVDFSPTFYCFPKSLFLYGSMALLSYFSTFLLTMYYSVLRFYYIWWLCMMINISVHPSGLVGKLHIC